MSPKEEATAVKLLARWLEMAKKSVLATEPGAKAGELIGLVLEMQRLEEETQAFITHEDPDA